MDYLSFAGSGRDATLALRDRFSPLCGDTFRILTEFVQDHPYVSAYGAFCLVSAVRARVRKIIKQGTWLELDLNDIILQEQELSQFAKWMNPKAVDIHHLVETLDRAGEDERIAGLILKVGRGNHFMPAHVEELRNALTRFRSGSNKVTIAYAESFGEYGKDTSAYWIASACEYVYMAPCGYVGLVTPMMEVPFLKQMFDKLAIGTHINKRKAYKSMCDMLTRENMSEAHKEVSESLMNALFDAFIRDMSAAREVDIDQARQLVSDGPFLPEVAKEGQLVDGLLYRDEIYTLIARAYKNNSSAVGASTLNALLSALKINTADEPATKDDDVDSPPEFPRLFLDMYAQKIGPATRKGGSICRSAVELVRKPPVVAVIRAEGAIHAGTSKTMEKDGKSTIGSDSTCHAIRSAHNDKNVKVILLRVNSGGGSAIASDLIYRELLVAKDKGIKVVVSMGAVAASGGYYMSAPADTIFASPTTLTGSIGVVLGKFDFSGLWNKFGISFDDVRMDENSTYFSATKPYTEQGEAQRELALDSVYEDFKGKVALGRNLTADQIEAVAQGRVWTGVQAKERGLVDRLGGYHEALAYATELAVEGWTGCGGKDRAVVAAYPPPMSLFKKILLGAPQHSDSPNAVTSAVAGLINVLPGIHQSMRFLNTASSVVSMATHGRSESSMSSALSDVETIGSGDVCMASFIAL